MKKLYIVITALLLAVVTNAQCNIDTTQLPLTGSGIFPSAAHLPHIVKDSLYDQTVMGKITDTMNMNFGGFVSVSIRVDSVRLDSINGLPTGINWVKNPDVLRGGGYGCVEFSGVTSDTAGTYMLHPIGMIWAHLSAPIIGLDVDTFSYGAIDRFPPFRNYYVVVDSAQQPLTVKATVINLCYGDTGTGRATAFASGGSPLAPYQYVWNTGSTSYTITNLNTGTYSVTVICGTDTVSTTADVTIEPTPISLTLTADSSTNGSNGTAIVVANGGVPPYRYNWQGGGNADSLTGLAPGTYRVTVRDSFNCIMRDSVVVPGIVNTGIGTLAQSIPLFSVYPNPATDELNVLIETSLPLSAKIEAVDVTGRVVYSSPLNISGRFSKKIPLTQFSPGVYLVQITAGKQTVQKQFVVAR
jgi:hypothetical protein